MKRVMISMALVLAMGTVVKGQQLQLGQSENCLTSVTGIPTKERVLPNAIKAYVPSSAFIRFVIPLSATDTLTIYELGNWARHRTTAVNPPALSDPDTQLLITRRGRPVFRFALEDLSTWRVGQEAYPGWAATLEAMSVAHLCSPKSDLTYLVLQTGNSGGYYIALQRAKQTYKVIPVSGATQGRLILSKSNPEAVEVWSATDAGVCTACPRPFTIKHFRFDGLKFRLISQSQTKRSYVGFQDEPLVVHR